VNGTEILVQNNQPDALVNDKHYHMMYPVHLTTGKVRVMLFKATFNNISDILWKSVLLVEGTEVHIENYQPAAVNQ
jgi:hypothetical protein